MRGKCLSDLTPAKSFSTDSHEARDCTGGMSSISRRWFRLASARSGVSSLHVSRDSDAPIEPAPRSVYARVAVQAVAWHVERD